MKKKLYFMLILLLALSTRLSAQGLVVIINPGNSIKNISFKNLKKIYKAGKQKWDNGKKIKLATLNIQNGPGKVFIKKIYGMSTDEYKKYWLQKVFRGEAKAPARKNGTQAMVDFVAAKVGAIGFVPRGTALNGVKQLQIDGKNSGDAGYPLP